MEDLSFHLSFQIKGKQSCSFVRGTRYPSSTFASNNTDYITFLSRNTVAVLLHWFKAASLEWSRGEREVWSSAVWQQCGSREASQQMALYQCSNVSGQIGHCQSKETAQMRAFLCANANESVQTFLGTVKYSFF